MNAKDVSWDWEISSKTSYWNESFKTIWSYRHFIASLIRRQFLLNYQQTILGPLWILFQPILTLITYVLVFGHMVRLPTGTLPPVLFYFAGIILWNFFSETFSGTSNTFRDNAHIFSKVYFPRIIIPLSVLATQFLRFLIQLGLLIIFTFYYIFFQHLQLSFSYWLFAAPIAIVCTGIIALGLGLIFSVITAKYRDMGNLVSVGLRLLMFVTPVIYPLASVSKELVWIVKVNPLTSLFELFKLSLLGEGSFYLSLFFYSVVFMLAITTIAVLVFNKQGDKLIDVV